MDERLAQLKKDYKNGFPINIDWLIQQVEKVPELERDRGEWEIEAHTQNARSKRLEHQFHELYRKHFIKVDQLEKQNQRYKEGLEEIAKEIYLEGDPDLVTQNKLIRVILKARQVLKGEST